MQEVMLALLAGLIVGLLFAFLKLPIPAPPVFSGIIGIVGIYLGYQGFTYLWG
ncbi:XapX domain-containing protein [Alkalihalobacillus sp. 1P02AB]|uniref:XapX domain-containing protein n=1 Tax=Alkalihalobacillus sp. 1P02AB TaxID=3132260 RepID=UPI0039A53A62